MKYDKKRLGNIGSAGVSCAFNQARVQGTPERRYERQIGANGYYDWNQPARIVKESQADFETRLWETLCEILTSAEQRPVLVPTTDREPVWRDLVAMCPHAELIADARSRHGNYRAHLWLFDLRKGQYK
jgi:hypothetical protein